MKKSQIKQYQKLSQFYQKEKSIISSYSLFSFPEINISDDKTIKSNAQIPLEYFGNYLDTYCKEEKIELKLDEVKIEEKKEEHQKEILKEKDKDNEEDTECRLKQKKMNKKKN